MSRSESRSRPECFVMAGLSGLVVGMEFLIHVQRRHPFSTSQGVFALSDFDRWALGH